MDGVVVESSAAGGGGARPGLPIPNLRATHPDAFAHGCGRKDCFRGAAAPDCEFHGSLVRDIIRSRREERRARLQQRCRTHSTDDTVAMTAAAAAASASRNVTPLRRRPSQSSSRPGSPQSFASSEFSLPCASPLMEDLMLEVTGAIESSGMDPRVVAMASQQRTDMDDIFRLIDEARREYESLAGPPVAQMRYELVDVVNVAKVADEVRWARKNSWDSLLGLP